MKIFYTKKDKNIVEGLEMLKDAMTIQLEYATSNLKREDLSEYLKGYWTARESHCRYVLDEINLILTGKLHY